jgi:hypothetical protein
LTRAQRIGGGFQFGGGPRQIVAMPKFDAVFREWGDGHLTDREISLREAFGEGRRAVTTDDIVRALKASPPISVVMSDRVAELREWATGRCVPAD